MADRASGGTSSSPASGLPVTLCAVADHLSDGVYFTTVAGVLTYANEVCLRWLGIDAPEELAGQTIDDLWADAASRAAGYEEGGAARRLTRREGDDLRLREFRVPHHDDAGDCIGYFGILVREPGASGVTRDGPSRARATTDPPLLEPTDPRRGCLVFEVDLEEGSPEANASRDLAHLIVRLTRPEDLVTELDDRRVVLFAEVASPAALKAIAERVVARGRREVDAAFHVGVAMRIDAEPALAAIERASRATYLRKRQLRGRVTGARSGPHRAA